MAPGTFASQRPGVLLASLRPARGSSPGAQFPFAFNSPIHRLLSAIVNSVCLLLTLAAPPAYPDLPDRLGVAGAFAGVSNGSLLVAGGANFPGKPPWEGGQKVWHDKVYALDKPDGTWRVAGKLPRPLAYGVSVTHGDGVVCVGGSDAERHYADAFTLRGANGTLTTTTLPTLPRPLANLSGALVGDHLYVAGGIETPTATAASKRAYRMDLSAARRRWEELPECPGPGRMLAVAAGFDGAFYLVGGCELTAKPGGGTTRKYLADAHRFTPATGWKRIADLPKPLAAAPSPAPTDATGFTILGGDDGKLVDIPPDKHRGFPTAVDRYDATKDKWLEAGTWPPARVTAPCVNWRGSWVVPSGEIRPGVRVAGVVGLSDEGVRQ